MPKAVVRVAWCAVALAWTLLGPIHGHGQVGLSVRSGVSSSMLLRDANEEPNRRTMVTGGARVSVPLNARAFLAPEIMFASRGGGEERSSPHPTRVWVRYEVPYEFDYVDINTLVGVQAGGDGWSLRGLAGPTVGVLVRALESNSARTGYFKRFDVGGTASFEAVHAPVSVEVRGSYFVTRSKAGGPGGPSAQSWSSLSLGLLLGVDLR